MDWAALAARIEASSIGTSMRESALAYPVANLVHLLGLVMLVGAIGLVDLRVAGALTRLPLKPVVAALTPFGVTGLLLLAVSGPLLFAADAIALSRSDMFLRKLVLIAIALANALFFRWHWRRSGPRADAVAKISAIASVCLWIAVAALGRLIAYR